MKPTEPLSFNITLTIKSECIDEYLQALAEVLPAARAEKTCVYLNVGQSVDDPRVFVLSEHWQDRDDFINRVLATPHYQKYTAISQGLYAEPRRVVQLRTPSGVEGG